MKRLVIIVTTLSMLIVALVLGMANASATTPAVESGGAIMPSVTAVWATTNDATKPLPNAATVTWPQTYVGKSLPDCLPVATIVQVDTYSGESKYKDAIAALIAHGTLNKPGSAQWTDSAFYMKSYFALIKACIVVTTSAPPTPVNWPVLAPTVVQPTCADENGYLIFPTNEHANYVIGNLPNAGQHGKYQLGLGTFIVTVAPLGNVKLFGYAGDTYTFVAATGCTTPSSSAPVPTTTAPAPITSADTPTTAAVVVNAADVLPNTGLDFNPVYLVGLALLLLVLGVSFCLIKRRDSGAMHK